MIALRGINQEQLDRAKFAGKDVEFVPVSVSTSLGLYSVRSTSTPGKWYVAGFVKEEGEAKFYCGCKANEHGRLCRHYPNLARHYRRYLAQALVTQPRKAS